MKAAVLNSSSGLDVAELAPQPLIAGQVRVAVSLCGICGSDLHWRRHFPAGTVMGHEVVGIVAELGAGVEGWALGERVVIMPIEPCGTCTQCLAGRPNICASRLYGIGGPRARGGYAQSTVVLASMLLRIPDTLSDRAAALVEPLSVGIHGVAMSHRSSADPLLVMGAGTIGLMTALALKARGFTRILAVEPLAARRKIMEAAGIPAIDSVGADVLAPATLGEAPAGIFECAGYRGALVDATRMIAPRGRIVLLSAPSEPAPLPQWDLMMKEAEIGTAIFYTRAEFQEAIDLLTSGRVSADVVPTSIFALKDAPGALCELLAPGTPHLKVLLKP